MIGSFREIKDEQLKECGGKGASLIRLTRAGLPVPPGYVLTVGSDASEVRSIVSGLKGTYAVRSSALNEDGSKASFAGAYETMTDVKPEDIEEAIRTVQKSADSLRVEEYAKNQEIAKEGIAVVIQEFVKPEFAGVVFTSDPITGSAARMIGNYVKGEGELLVSGSANAEEFVFDAIKYSYSGNEEFRRYAKKLFGYCKKIRDLWNAPMDIEWAVSGGKVYILQARPITSLVREKEDTYLINGSLGGEYLLTKTNVGEIFMMPMSPLTYSIMRGICNSLGMPYFIDNVYGQAYMNISAVCSVLVSLGMSRKKAFEAIKDIAGNMPEGMDVPIFPVSRSAFLKNLLELIRPKKQNKDLGLKSSPYVSDLIDKTKTPNELYTLWNETVKLFINSSLGEIFKGANIVSLFGTRNKIEKVCGEDLGGRLIAGSLGILDSMKPLLLLEDLDEGKITAEEYIRTCGHRHANEMELMCPYPYEDPDFPANAVQRHRESGINAHKMKEEQEKQYRAAVEEFKAEYPGKVNWLNKKLKKYDAANKSRESVRSEGVKIFCVLRKFFLKAGSLMELGDYIFMLSIDEVLSALEGDRSCLDKIAARKETYTRYLEYPLFPNLICGRFDPDVWLNDPNRRNDIFVAGEGTGDALSDDVKGFAGAAGKVTGIVHVINDVKDADQLKQGEILVTTATNIGWTTIFPRAAAIITDIGAPLSHAAIVAREFGIPAVVGCGNATTVLHTGDKVIVDGSNGTVTKC